jgi:hypothetical protein
LNVRKIALLWSLAGLWSCGSQTKLAFDQVLQLVMFGIFEAPPDAIGNAEPKSQTYQLKGFSITKTEGAEVVNLYPETIDPSVIISRSQIIHEGDLTDLEDTSFSKLTVEFEPQVTVKGDVEDALALTLTEPVLTLDETFVIEKAQKLRLNVKVQWKNTILYDDSVDPPKETVTSPGFILDLTTASSSDSGS